MTVYPKLVLLQMFPTLEVDVNFGSRLVRIDLKVSDVHQLLPEIRSLILCATNVESHVARRRYATFQIDVEHFQ